MLNLQSNLTEKKKKKEHEWMKELSKRRKTSAWHSRLIDRDYDVESGEGKKTLMCALCIEKTGIRQHWCTYK